jgi:hypothetical protein
VHADEIALQPQDWKHYETIELVLHGIKMVMHYCPYSVLKGWQWADSA